jgi:hypothetical protein
MSVGMRIALKPHTTLRTVQTFSVDQNMNITMASRENDPPVRFGWATLDGTTSLDYLEDQITGVSYITLKGRRIADLSEAIRRDIATWSFQEAVQLISSDGDRDTVIQGIYVSAISAARKDVPAILSSFRSAIHHSDREVRRALLIGIGYATVNEAFREIAEDIRDFDPDEGIRRNAGDLLTALTAGE